MERDQGCGAHPQPRVVVPRGAALPVHALVAARMREPLCGSVLSARDDSRPGSTCAPDLALRPHRQLPESDRLRSGNGSRLRRGLRGRHVVRGSGLSQRLCERLPQSRRSRPPLLAGVRGASSRRVLRAWSYPESPLDFLSRDTSRGFDRSGHRCCAVYDRRRTHRWRPALRLLGPLALIRDAARHRCRTWRIGSIRDTSLSGVVRWRRCWHKLASLVPSCSVVAVRLVPGGSPRKQAGAVRAQEAARTGALLQVLPGGEDRSPHDRGPSSPPP
jgi:hypothetical protein